MADSIRILHVEDDHDFAELTSTFLNREDERFTVSNAFAPDEARDRLDGESFDCVVSDYDMPGQSGLSFLESIRSDYPDLPFILFTGKGSEEVASDAISAGVTDYLQKESGSEQYELLANRITTAVEQYRTERELERQNDLFAKSQDLANVGAWEYNRDTGRSYASDQVLRIHGLPVDAQLSPEDSIQHYHSDDQETIRQAFEAAVNEGTPYDLVLRLITEDGDQRWVRTRGEPQYEDGEITRLRGTLQDITEQKRREQDLERQNERLEEFARVISHDIRNPLQVASGQLELAEETGDEAPIQKGKDALDRIDAIIENVLTLARHGQSVTERSEVQLSAIATDAWSSVETGDMTLDIDGETTLEADPERLRQLFENLFRNSVEHNAASADSQAGQGSGGTVTVGPIEPMFTSTRATGETRTGFYVADDGPGIPKHHRDSVFDAGFTTATDSTGSGLAIVAQIAKAHGWQPTVSENHSGGARFEFIEQSTTTDG